MLLKELIEYEQLSVKDKYLYRFIWERHPNWNHEMIMFKIAIEHKVD